MHLQLLAGHQLSKMKQMKNGYEILCYWLRGLPIHWLLMLIKISTSNLNVNLLRLIQISWEKIKIIIKFDALKFWLLNISNKSSEFNFKKACGQYSNALSSKLQRTNAEHHTKNVHDVYKLKFCHWFIMNVYSLLLARGYSVDFTQYPWSWCILTYSRVQPHSAHNYQPGTHLYTWAERGTDCVITLPKDANLYRGWH